MLVAAGLPLSDADPVVNSHGKAVSGHIPTVTCTHGYRISVLSDTARHSAATPPIQHTFQQCSHFHLSTNISQHYAKVHFIRETSAVLTTGTVSRQLHSHCQEDTEHTQLQAKADAQAASQGQEPTPAMNSSFPANNCSLTGLSPMRNEGW